MQQVLVSDTSVLIDLKRGSLLEASFCLAFRFVVPDLLYERELKNWGGEDLIRLGLVVEALDGDGVSLALAYRKRMPALSLPRLLRPRARANPFLDPVERRRCAQPPCD